ncbi:MAG: flotillin-like protein FloA [Gemmatimonadota bacterium]
MERRVDENGLQAGLLIALVFVGFIFLMLFFRFVPIGLWIRARASGVNVSFGTLFGMRLRRVNPIGIIDPMVNAHKAGLNLSMTDLEAHFLAGGRVENVVRALIAADKAGIPLSLKQATAIDLAGRDVFEAVQVSVNPKVITTPKVAAMAKNGIQLLAIARVTVRANLNRLVGGAGEETILARVGEGIVSAIGSADSHKLVLENPDVISKTVLAKGLDAGTAFEILSIDIADVDVGKNIGAELQTDQAEADKRIAQAKAEERRALAVAMEQEYKAESQAMRAKVIEAEAQIPLAISEAFRSGHLGVMDYQRYRNVMADTTMRTAIAGQSDSDKAPGV